jgi:hypothetical protein
VMSTHLSSHMDCKPPVQDIVGDLVVTKLVVAAAVDGNPYRLK